MVAGAVLGPEVMLNRTLQYLMDLSPIKQAEDVEHEPCRSADHFGCSQHQYDHQPVRMQP